MFIVRALQKLTRAAKIVCYVALGGLIVYFPFGYLGEALIYPIWKWAPLLERMAIKDSMPYLFVLAVVCAFLQVFDSFLSRRTGEESHGADATTDAARVDSKG